MLTINVLISNTVVTWSCAIFIMAAVALFMLFPTHKQQVQGGELVPFWKAVSRHMLNISMLCNKILQGSVECRSEL